MQVSVQLTNDGLLKHQVDKISLLDGRINFCEVLYVASGLKPVTRFLLSEQNLDEAKGFIESLGLSVYAPCMMTSDKGMLKRMIYIAKKEEDAHDALAAELEGDHERLGILLGYPECCIKFFVRNQEKARMMYDDYTLLALENSFTKYLPFYTNISLRYFDCMFINHFPCSFNCSRSLESAKRYAECIARCAPHLYDELVHSLRTAVVYADETGVHAFKGVQFTREGFHYKDVRLTSEKEFHHLLKRGNFIKVIDRHHFVIMRDNEIIQEVKDPLIGVLQFSAD
ncbi:MAG: DUF483 domain-containing protein [Nanoarchaeota archaeon]|nr:DUF483 domain-containing protein [Nanoarchaeota archaeon]